MYHIHTLPPVPMASQRIFFIGIIVVALALGGTIMRGVVHNMVQLRGDINSYWMFGSIQNVFSQSNNSAENDTELKIILLWNSYFDARDFGFGYFGREGFVSHGCEVNTCRLETDRSLLSKASAVVVHMKGDVEPFPERSNPEQLFVLYLRESAKYRGGYPNKYRTRFNITMTYRSDSDIPSAPFECIPIGDGKMANYSLKYPFVTKKRNIAWLVSHCQTASKREVYVSALSKYISVDIYGRCGRLKCPKVRRRCMNEFQSKYKFYLSFENSFCKDYVTEKYYRLMPYEMIPVVYGDVDYSALGPPVGSYINILDYRSPKDLADYLHYLARNETAYAEYFYKRGSWKCVYNDVKGFCQLCELVHNVTFRKMYSDVDKWLREDACDDATVRRVIDSTKLD